MSLSDERAVIVVRDELVQARRTKNPSLDHANIQRSINDLDAWLGEQNRKGDTHARTQ